MDTRMLSDDQIGVPRRQLEGCLARIDSLVPDCGNSIASALEWKKLYTTLSVCDDIFGAKGTYLFAKRATNLAKCTPHIQHDVIVLRMIYLGLYIAFF